MKASKVFPFLRNWKEKKKANHSQFDIAHQAPNLLIGHSLGGAAILKATQDIPESLGLVTIGAPASAELALQ